MASDDEDFVFYGTPIEREEDITTRKKKAVAEASGQLRTALAPWKQEVTDEEGRRRFHGAFTGGFSAGYFNSVGSKEGWTPQTFTSSRKNRAEVKQQDIFNFLDEDEKSELEGRSLGTSMQFDTFGFTAAELARKQAEKEQKQRPSTIPGPVPDELIIPATESIGVKLLLKMGWRQGRSIKDSNMNSLNDARREARKAFLALSSEQPGGPTLDEEDTRDVLDLPTDNDDQFCKSTPAYVLNPKQDLHGLGYDPFKQAPEFREMKRQRISGHSDMERNRSLSMKGKVGPGFGIGALEDLDAEDEDVYASGYDFQDTYVQEIEETSRVNMDNLRILDKKKSDVLHGFKAASNLESLSGRFDPPAIPEDFVPRHKFPAPVGNNSKIPEVPPPEVPPPEDNNLKVLIEGVATLVARCGRLFEDLSREKNQSNPLFSFLSGGNGCDFYARKLWEQCQKSSEHTKLLGAKMYQNSEKLTAKKRGKILGEKALEGSSKDSSSLVASKDPVILQFKLSDTFTTPSSDNGHRDIIKPFHDDPAKQKRFEQFLKEKYEGGLRTKDSGGSSSMSETARARERLEFEAAIDARAKGNSGNESKDLLTELSTGGGLQFTSGGLEKDKVQQDDGLMIKSMYPKREEFQWRPAPILCKRFDLIDPYMGKPPPAPRVKSKMDSLIFMPDSIKTANEQRHGATEQKSTSMPQIDSGKQGRDTTEKAVESEVEVENVERPVDLYKAIFSDDSEDEVENAAPNQVEDTQKKIEVANTTLNRLMAGDFLQSLGKELGLDVPPDLPPLENKAGLRDTKKETVNTDTGVKDFPFSQQPRSNAQNAGEERKGNKSDDVLSTREGKSNHGKLSVGMGIDGSKFADLSEETRFINIPEEKRNHNRGGSSSEHRKSRKHSKHKHRSRSRSRSRNLDSDMSSDSDDYQVLSRSKRKEKRSSGDKSSSRRRSKHHRHKRHDSSRQSHHGSGEDSENHKRKKHKY